MSPEFADSLKRYLHTMNGLIDVRELLKLRMTI